MPRLIRLDHCALLLLWEENVAQEETEVKTMKPQVFQDSPGELEDRDDDLGRHFDCTPPYDLEEEANFFEEEDRHVER